MSPRQRNEKRTAQNVPVLFIYIIYRAYLDYMYKMKLLLVFLILYAYDRQVTCVNFSYLLAFTPVSIHVNFLCSKSSF